MSYTVLIPQDIMQEGKDYLIKHGYEIKMGSGITVEAIQADVADCDAILARTAPFPAAVLEAGKKLRVVARHGVGVDNIDVKRAEELGIWVTNAPESNSNTVAEHTVLLILALLRRLIPVNESFRGGNFEVRNQLRGNDLAGKTLGIVGLGKIGRLVSRKMAAFDIDIIGYDAVLNPEQYPEGVTASDGWDDLFTRADFVTLHIPATKETAGIVGEREFRLMKSTACIINTARGEIIDEGALITALQNGDIGGAGLDVFAQEPPDVKNPLIGMQNVVATPHNAALTDECMIRMAVHAAMGIDDVFCGRTPKWPVNEPKGGMRS